MSHRIPIILALLLATAGFLPSGAMELGLNAVDFPERKSVELEFARRPGAPAARIEADVTYRSGQAQVELSFRNMKPAILYGGDVTCYVAWAISPDGQFENLGEMVTREADDKVEFSTGKKSFALIVTAEPFYLVRNPSELVIFYNLPAKSKAVRNRSFAFSDFATAPDRAMKDIENIRWDSQTPLELLQARKAFELATRNEAEALAPRTYKEARLALAKANNLAEYGGRALLDESRRAVALSNVAINIARNRREAAELERQIALRRSEMERLERRASEAETRAEQSRLELERTEAERNRLREEAITLSAEKTSLERTKSELETSLLSLREEKASLEQERQALAREKAQLAGRLEEALSHVAETRSTARGMVVNLPDILFDVNEATLKPEAKIVLAKLAGILLIMPDLTLRIEGHTDSTGSPEYNQRLSEQRAGSVMSFLTDQEVAEGRMSAVGYGMDRPVADNATREGRQKNRRVEIVIS